MPKRETKPRTNSKPEDSETVTIKPDGTIAPVTEVASEPDSRAPFKPRSEGSDGPVTSVTIPLKDGKADFEKMRDKTLERLREAVSGAEAKRRLGLVRGDGDTQITVKAMGPLFGMLGMIEGLAVSYVAKIPFQAGIGIMMLSDAEFQQVAPLAAEILEAQAPAWLRNFLLSDNAKIGQLLTLLFQIHQQKLEQIKQFKLQMAGEAPVQSQTAVN